MPNFVTAVHMYKYWWDKNYQYCRYIRSWSNFKIYFIIMYNVTGGIKIVTTCK